MAGYLLFRAWEYLFSPAVNDNIPQEGQLTNPATLDRLYYRPSELPSGPIPEIRYNSIDGSIYGFPPFEPIIKPRSFFAIQKSCPAVRLYILGPDWESQLVKIPPNDRWNYTHGCVPIPFDATDEAKHVRLMKRCGALLHETTHLWEEAAHGRNPYHDLSKRQIFGWPSGGGVWIYRLPSVLFETDRSSVDEGLDYLAKLDAGEEVDYEQILYDLKKGLRLQIDMEGYCDILQDNGAVFYRNPIDCPEVRELDLWDDSS